MKVQELIHEVAKKVKKNIPPHTTVVLFGSWARGDALATSDIDIGIAGEKKLPFRTLVQIKEEIEMLPTLRSIDIVDLSAVSKRVREEMLKHSRVL